MVLCSIGFLFNPGFPYPLPFTRTNVLISVLYIFFLLVQTLVRLSSFLYTRMRGGNLCRRFWSIKARMWKQRCVLLVRAILCAQKILCARNLKRIISGERGNLALCAKTANSSVSQIEDDAILPYATLKGVLFLTPMRRK